MGSLRRFLSGSVRWLIAAARFLCLALPVLWATLAIYYSNLPWFELRLALAAAFAAFAIWALWFSRQRRMSILAAVLTNDICDSIGFCVVAQYASCRRRAARERTTGATTNHGAERMH